MGGLAFHKNVSKRVLQYTCIHTYICTYIQRKFSTQQTQSKCATQHLMQAKRFEKVLEATGHCTAHSYCTYSGKSHLAAEW